MPPEIGTGADEAPRVYAVRVSDLPAGQIESEQNRIQTTAGRAVAEAWAEGMADAIASLATYPVRCIVAVEDPLSPHGVLRQLVYQRRRDGPAWRILFTISEADENDPPTVRVHLIRHGSQQPMTEWPLGDEP